VYPFVSLYISPADPSLKPPFGPQSKVASYVANAQVFSDRPTFPGKVADGTSQTIHYAEKYWECGPEMYWNGTDIVVPMHIGYTSDNYSLNGRRASFADGGPLFDGRNPGDVYPIVGDGPTRPSRPGATFQTAPAVADCDKTLAQTPHKSGMLVGMGDGSVRTVAPGVAPEVFWGAVTPAAGDAADF
jgi:hypothetical protein